MAIEQNDEARAILKAIRDLALTVYPFPKGAKVDERYVMGLALAAGAATEALTAVHDGRPMRVKLGDR